MASSREITRHINTYANQRGIKIVKYHPTTHDPLLLNVGNWCNGHVGDDKINEVLDVY